ncbi:MAG: response regulator [Gammaproteobacteria bacterium]
MDTIQILVIDDDPSARDLLASTLRTIGYPRVHTAADQAAAEHMLKKTRIDVVFLDIELSGENGFEVMLALKQEAPQIGIVMVSAHSTMDNVKQAIKQGARGFVVKPYSLAKVKDVMAQFAG